MPFSLLVVLLQSPLLPSVLRTTFKGWVSSAVCTVQASPFFLLGAEDRGTGCEEGGGIWFTENVSESRRQCLSCTGQKEKPAALILLCHLKDTESILLLKNSSYSLARQIPTDLIFIWDIAGLEAQTLPIIRWMVLVNSRPCSETASVP